MLLNYKSTPALFHVTFVQKYVTILSKHDYAIFFYILYSASYFYFGFIFGLYT